MRNQYIFIRIPKTGTQSISSSLGIFNTANVNRQKIKKLKDNSSKKRIKCVHLNKKKKEYPDLFLPMKDFPYHSPCKKYIEELGKDEFKQYTSFTFVRNPYDRFVSLYSFLDSRKLKYDNIKHFAESFEDNISSIGVLITQPQKDFLIDENNRIVIDRIYRFENIDEDWETLSGELKIDKKLAGINASVHKSWQWYYEKYPELKDIILEIYGEDFEAFGYSKEIK